MTREEAREILTHNWTRVDNPNYAYEELDGAFHMAIEALQTDAVQGEWVDWLGNGNEWECSICKCSIESHGSIAYKYCPMCGARMKGGDTE